MSKFEKYWKELRRRHVVKAGLAYLVVAWLVLQVLDLLLDAFQLGAGWMQTTIIILSVGFPIWLILAWVYDFSWGSIQKTEDVPFDAEVFQKKNVGLNRVIIGGLSIAVILLVVNTFYIRGQMDELQSTYKDVLATNYASSIAVMAFDDLSPKQDQDYFARGLSQQIQQRLTKHKDLKVINTNSTFTYQGKDISIPVIGKELDVAYVLEGSVLKSGETFRVNLQLVSTDDGSNIWSKQFDQKLEDVLYTIDEIAGNVVQYLSLTFNYQDVRLRKVDPEAFLLRLKAEDTLEYYSPATTIIADSLIRRSINIDPTYARSYSIFSMITLHMGIYYDLYSKNEAIRIGIEAAKQAIELDPNDPFGNYWLSNWQWHNREVRASNENLARTLEIGSNNSEVLQYASHQAARLNRIDESLAFNDKALLLDPKNVDAWDSKSYAEMMINDFDSAEVSNKKWIELSPIGKEQKYLQALIVYQTKGNAKMAYEILKEQPDQYFQLFAKCLLLFSENNLAEAYSTLETFKNLPVEKHHEWAILDYELAIIYAHFSDKDKAFYHLDKGFDDIAFYLEFFFVTPQFKNLYDDPRWDAYIDRLSEEFNYDFPHRPE